MPTVRGQVQTDIQTEDYIIGGDWNFNGQNNFTDLNIFSKESALTNTVQNLETFQHTTSGTPANGIGLELQFEQETSPANNEIIGTFGFKATDVTPASEDGEYFINLMNAGAAAAEVLNLKPNQLLINGNIVSSVSGTDGIFVLEASSVDKVQLNTNGDSFLNGGDFGLGTSTPDQKWHAKKVSALTNAVQIIGRYTHTTSGTPANGIGVGIEFEQETSASNNEIIGNYAFVTTDVTAAVEDADFVLSLMEAGAASAEKFRVTSKGDTVVNDSLEVGDSGTRGDGTNIITLLNGTHGTQINDTTQLASADISAGNTTLSLQTEGTPIAANTPAQTHTLQVKINGTDYWIALSNTAT
jgi:hypothetical protein